MRKQAKRSFRDFDSLYKTEIRGQSRSVSAIIPAWQSADPGLKLGGAIEKSVSVLNIRRKSEEFGNMAHG